MNKKFTKSILALAFLMLGTTSLFAQIEITGYGGYACADRFDFYYGSGKVYGKGLYGASIGTQTSRGSMLEFMWQHTSTTLDVYNYTYGSIIEDVTVDLNMDYYMLNFGYSREAGDSPVSPFATVMLGGANASSPTTDESLFMFCMGFQAGVKIFPNDRVGFRMQGALLMPVQGTSGGFGCSVGTGGSGCGTSVYTYSTITQMTFSGGLILRLGN